MSAKTRKTEVGTKLPKVGTMTETAPVVPNPSAEERGNLQFATVQPGTVNVTVGGPGSVSGWKGVTFPRLDRLTLRGDAVDVSGLYLTTPEPNSTVYTRRGVTTTLTTTRTPRGYKTTSSATRTDAPPSGPTLDGFSVSSVIRWCGSQGFTAGPVGRAVATGWGVEVNPLTVATQIQHGRKGKMSIPVLPVDLQCKLRDLIASATK